MMNKLFLTLVILGLLMLASTITYIWGRQNLEDEKRRLQQEVHKRIRSWWLMSMAFLTAWWVGFIAIVLLFAIISALALREYLTLIATNTTDHRALVWSFLLLAPFQYYLIAIQWYGLYSIFIPVYGFLFITTRIAVSGDCERFLERVAKIHWGLMICVFLLSHAPALLTLPIVGYQADKHEPFLCLILLTELSDIFQFIAGKSFGHRKIAPNVSPNKTIEGLIGGMLGTALCSLALSPYTPFPWWLDGILGALICLFGFCGGLCFSAVKRDRGCKDFGTLISGHGGILDRVDSLCFTAPLYFHFVRYFYTL